MASISSTRWYRRSGPARSHRIEVAGKLEFGIEGTGLLEYGSSPEHRRLHQVATPKEGFEPNLGLEAGLLVTRVLEDAESIAEDQVSRWISFERIYDDLSVQGK